MKADLVVDAGENKYIIEVKAASEGRRDRLIPLLSQAILQAQAYARLFSEPAIPLAVVGAKHVPASVAEQLMEFAKRNAPDVAVGVIDAEGFRSFIGPGLEGLDRSPSRRGIQIVSSQSLPDLFSDLNQWMLKILLGQQLPEKLICVPRGPIRSASQLAEVAKVSVMSASRLVNQLASRGFLGEREEHLQVVRVEEFLDLWSSANRQAAKEIPARWIIKGGPHQLESALRGCPPRDSSSSRGNKPHNGGIIHSRPHSCLALFAAADALGFGFVRGVPPHIYLNRLTLDSMNRLGLLVDHSDRAPDIYIRIPVQRESVFRAAIVNDGVGVSDVLQVWLDVSVHPARGREQADEIHRRALKPLFAKQR